jgi:hypothetical protein
MPTVSKKQHNFMEMVAHNPAAAKRTGVPQSVGKEFVEADKGQGKAAQKRKPTRRSTLYDHPRSKR